MFVDLLITVKRFDMGKTSDPFYVVSHSSPNIRTPDALLLLTAQVYITV